MGLKELNKTSVFSLSAELCILLPGALETFKTGNINSSFRFPSHETSSIKRTALPIFYYFFKCRVLMPEVEYCYTEWTNKTDKKISRIL
jgi:hypothetical protein